jgi:3-hexulose-6-phosphate synthase
VHIIGVHTGLDQQAAGHTPFADLGLVSGLKTGAKVSVAGGVKAATTKQVVDAGADIVVAGAAIYGAADPAAAASEITKIAHGASTSAKGGNKLLPWIIAAVAAVLVFSLLGKKSEEAAPAAETPVTEEAAPAAEAPAAEAPVTEEAAPAATTEETAPAAEAPAATN